MSAAGIDPSSSLPLFRQLTFHKTTNSYALRSSGLSYSSFREAFKDALNPLGYDASEYGLHSLGQEELRKNDVSERLLKLHGRWESDFAKDMYVQETLDERLKVTRCLEP